MAHHIIKSGYIKLADRLNRFPQGAFPSKLLYKILEMLFSEKEAKLVSLLPLRPFTVEKAGQAWKMDRVNARKILDQLCSRAILIDIEENGRQVYCLPPPMAGFFEFSLMRITGDIDQKLLSELYYQYINVEEDFIKNLFLFGETRLGRVFVHEPVLSRENALHVLDYERATEVIKTASHIGISTCYCRHKMAHMDRDCDAPKQICMTFNTTAASLAKHGFARQVEVVECLELLDTAYSHNLVQFGDNVRKDMNFICNCCGCCCEAMIVARKFAILHPVHTTNFIPQIKDDECTGCRKCVTVCPVEAMSLVSANDPHHPKKKKARVNTEICLGCGVCARICPEDCINLRSRAQRVITPLNTAHRVVAMAIERGKLQNFIFDNQVLQSHRAMAAVIGVILKLPPIKQAMASQQMKSIYLEALFKRLNF
jgi:Pyruvate/2-oxoacid:ferredoxin oxidoreductase delta subunit